MDEIKKIEKNEETGTPGETPSEPVEGLLFFHLLKML